jgi:transposase
MARLLLNDEQWELIEPLLGSGRSTSARGRPPADRRKVLNGILWILRTGAPWRDMPQEFGAWQTAWRLFDQWNRDGTLDRLVRSLQATRIQDGKLNQELWCIDGSVVRAARCAAGGGKKGIRKSPKTTH